MVMAGLAWPITERPISQAAWPHGPAPREYGHPVCTGVGVEVAGVGGGVAGVGVEGAGVGVEGAGVDGRLLERSSLRTQDCTPACVTNSHPGQSDEEYSTVTAVPSFHNPCLGALSDCEVFSVPIASFTDGNYP